MADDGQEKTHEASEKKKRDAAEKGQMVKSKEINSALILLVGAASGGRDPLNPLQGLSIGAGSTQSAQQAHLPFKDHALQLGRGFKGSQGRGQCRVFIGAQ